MDLWLILIELGPEKLSSRPFFLFGELHIKIYIELMKVFSITEYFKFKIVDVLKPTRRTAIFYSFRLISLQVLELT